MGRNRTPSAILDAKGAFIANPQRRRTKEPQGTLGIGVAPRRLTDEEKAVWKELADDMPDGVLQRSDRNMFELLVVLTVKFRSREPMMAAEQALMVSLASRFAMTPADRSKVEVESAPESKLSQFLNRKKEPAEQTLQ